jgi:hypothetical protein
MKDHPDLPINERLTVLNTLYPWYKEEVFRRREQMMRLTAFACSFLLLLLFMLLVTPDQPIRHLTVKVLASIGVVGFAALFGYLILQQRERHRMAKQALIDIERALGLYEDGIFLEGQALYPASWQTAWLGDRSVTVYLVLIAALTGLVIAAVLASSS